MGKNVSVCPKWQNLNYWVDDATCKFCIDTKISIFKKNSQSLINSLFPLSNENNWQQRQRKNIKQLLSYYIYGDDNLK